MIHHSHGYTWSGQAAELYRPLQPRRPNDPGFVTSPLPPVHRTDWFYKVPALVADTSASSEQALAWMDHIWAPYQERVRYPARIDWPDRRQAALRALTGGRDAHWEEYLVDGGYVIVQVLCCPHRVASHPCPLFPREAGPGACAGFGRGSASVTAPRGGATTIPRTAPPAPYPTSRPPSTPR
ncbi:hypothetical protein [Nonomuraea endophytica]|uniref:hypothetical protein n=1 Tax=Nonomuraea endophytica TaxID=714136 RepID=UPI0037CB561A